MKGWNEKGGKEGKGNYADGKKNKFIGGGALGG